MDDHKNHCIDEELVCRYPGQGFMPDDDYLGHFLDTLYLPRIEL